MGKLNRRNEPSEAGTADVERSQRAHVPPQGEPPYQPMPLPTGEIPNEPCSKPFHHLNAISRPYAFTLRNHYATTTGAYAGDYGQHNLTRRLRDGVSCRKMTPDCSASLRIPMSQGRYIQMCFFCPGICLKASLVTGFGVRGRSFLQKHSFHSFSLHVIIECYSPTPLAAQER